MKHLLAAVATAALIVAAGGLTASTVSAQDAAYHTAPGPMAALAEALPTPQLILSPSAGAAPRRALVAQPYGIRAIAELAEPELRLAGFRFNPTTYAKLREPWGLTYYRGLALQDFPTGTPQPVAGLPTTGRITSVEWSPDGRTVLATVAGFDDGQGHGLWVVDAETGRASRIEGVFLNGVLSPPCRWMADSQSMLCRTVPADRGPEPVRTALAIAPSVQSSEGPAAPGRTYQDLLTNPGDEALFDYHMTTQVAVVGVDGRVTPVGAPTIVDVAEPSPDGAWVLLSERVRPYSYQFPIAKFPQRISVVRLSDGARTVLAEKPLEDAVPISFDAVGVGPRATGWRSDAPATVYWLNALDGGDPNRDVALRDEVATLSAPFDQPARTLAQVPTRISAVHWGDASTALIEETWYKTRARRISRIDPTQPGAPALQLYAGASDDRYGDPGEPMIHANAAGAPVLDIAGSEVLFSGPGGTPEGDRPVVTGLSLTDGARREIWRSPSDFYEEPHEVLDDGRILVRRESATVSPNFYLTGTDGRETAVTAFASPYGDQPLAQRRMLHYTRADRVPLTATLYLPPNYRAEDGPLPTILHAYPAEFKNREAAGQVNGSPNRYPEYGFYDLPPLLAQAGFAVLFNTSLPVIGEGEAEPNDTFVEQITAGASAAIDEGVRLGVVDRDRVGVTGHSYGAFMTGNLLAHTDLFKAGVALSGAYNRSLTPFGFQREERTYWQDPELYYRMSPFSYADQIKEPLLLIHGGADDNQGTFLIQSERFYAALKGNGTKTRLVVMPYEAHRYDARETTNDLLWEWMDWFTRYLQ